MIVEKLILLNGVKSGLFMLEFTFSIYIIIIVVVVVVVVIIIFLFYCPR